MPMIFYKFNDKLWLIVVYCTAVASLCLEWLALPPSKSRSMCSAWGMEG